MRLEALRRHEEKSHFQQSSGVASKLRSKAARRHTAATGLQRGYGGCNRCRHER